MEKEFDNFELYIKQSEFYDSLEKKADKIFDLLYPFLGDSDYTAKDYKKAEIIYCRYLHYFSLDYLRSKLKVIEDEDKQNEISHILTVCEKVIDNRKTELDDFFNEIKYPNIIGTKELDVFPFDEKVIENFLKSFDPITNDLQELINKIALAITYNAYTSVSQDCNEDKFLPNLYSLLSNQLENFDITDDKMGFIAKVDRIVHKLTTKLDVFEQPETITAEQKKPLLKGQFYLSWKYVRFSDGYIFLYHPSNTHSNAYRVEMKEAKSAYNQIDDYFIKNLPPILVKAAAGVITKAYDIPSINLNIIRLTDKINRKSEKITKVHKKLSLLGEKEIREYIEQLKSQYLNWLCTKQIEDYKIYYIREVKTNSGILETDEDAFVFTIGETDTEVTVLYENTNQFRSSLLFKFKKQELALRIEQIHEFFSSNLKNKRQMVSNKNVKDDLFTKNTYTRIFHKDLSQWKEEVINFINKR